MHLHHCEVSYFARRGCGRQDPKWVTVVFFWYGTMISKLKSASALISPPPIQAPTIRNKSGKKTKKYNTLTVLYSHIFVRHFRFSAKYRFTPIRLYCTRVKKKKKTIRLMRRWRIRGLISGGKDDFKKSLPDRSCTNVPRNNANRVVSIKSNKLNLKMIAKKKDKKNHTYKIKSIYVFVPLSTSTVFIDFRVKRKIDFCTDFVRRAVKLVRSLVGQPYGLKPCS